MISKVRQHPKFNLGQLNTVGINPILSDFKGPGTSKLEWRYFEYNKIDMNELQTGTKIAEILKIFIRFSIENLIANISFYVLSWPKLNFGCYLTFEIIF